MNIKSKMTKKTLKIINKITKTNLTLGRFLYAIRHSEDMSQVDFAEKLGISRQHLCDIEHGRKWVSPGLAVTYAEKLGYSKEQFVRLALQDMVDREGLDIIIEITPKRGKKFSQLKWAHA